MKRLVISICSVLFLVTSTGWSYEGNYSTKLFMQKNFKEINSSMDFIDKESPYTNPSTMTTQNTPATKKLTKKAPSVNKSAKKQTKKR